ncbi:MAG: carboxylating nicotinate-nucleotide diphosphorylase [Acidobacteria bacterium]|nr:carboxylating nicotinate-nucleotide diphosphorylase [Acidobacteriota bacterium]
MTGAAFAPLDPADYRDVVRRALDEDLAGGDVTSDATTTPGQRGRGEIRAKQACLLAGSEVAAEVFRQRDAKAVMRWRRRDGESCAAGEVIATVEGLAAALLSAERTALNFLQRLSGIATVARRYVAAADGRTTILDTRKTTPTLRALEKYAVRAGGATNHRYGLGDGLLIKDNHVRLAGSVSEAVRRARAVARGMPVEVETQSLAEVDEALDAGADVVLIDNLSDARTGEAIARCRGRARTEVSGGVTLGRLPALAALAPTYVSVGALTHSAPAVDISFEMAPGS